MQKVFRIKRRILLFIIIFLAGITILVIQNQIWLFHFLSKSNEVNGNLLIIEAWLPDSAIDMAYNESLKRSYDLIITSGIKTSELDYCMVAMNGYLIFYPENKFTGYNEKPSYLIEVLAHSKMDGKYCAHFNFFVNDSLIKDFNADKKARKYEINWHGSLENIDSLMIHFDNDLFDENGDRNLYIKELIIDNEIIIPYQYNSVVDFGAMDGKNRINNDFMTQPEVTRKKLIANGIEPSKIIAVTGEKTHINRTLKSAIAFRSWIKNSGYKVTGINIVTQGIHARRTWMTFKRVLGRSYKVGIISLPDSDSRSKVRSGLLSVVIETLDLIYYWIILIPY